MNIEEAQAEAVRRWGPTTQAEINPNLGSCDILIGAPRAEWKGWPPRTLLGWGETWEEALALAITRAEWHTFPKAENIPKQLELW